MSESWTDERLDEFARHVDHRFDRVEAELRLLRQETNGRFERIENRLDAMHSEMHAGLHQLNHTMLRFGGGAVVAIVVGFLGMIATQL